MPRISLVTLADLIRTELKKEGVEALRFQLGFVQDGGLWGTVPELLFEKKGLIPALQQLLMSCPECTVAYKATIHRLNADKSNL